MQTVKMHDQKGLKPAHSGAIRMERIVASSRRFPKPPRARGTKTSRYESAKRTRTTMDGDGRWWRTGGRCLRRVMVAVVMENGGGSAREQRARFATAESVCSLTKAAAVRGGGSRHFCPSAEKTRECNHVVQCVTRDTRAGDTRESSDRVLRRQ